MVIEGYYFWHVINPIEFWAGQLVKKQSGDYTQRKSTASESK